MARIVLNWHNFFVNNVTPLQIVNSLGKLLLSLLPSGQQSIDGYLDKLVDKIAKKVEGKKGPAFAPQQIHFRGLAQLNPEQQESFYKKLDARFGYDFRQNKQQVYLYSLQTTDNAVLDSVEVRNPEASKQAFSERHFIVTCMPRSNNYVDWMKQYQVYAKNLDATIIAFNYRGVGLSKGVVTNQHSLYMDAYAQAQRLIELGAKPENIAFMGECLGGNIAAHAAGTLQEEGHAVKLFNARSFRSLTSVIDARAKPAKDAPLWSPATWLNWLGYVLVKLLLIPIIYTAGWGLNIEKQFAAIPPHDRDYLVVRSKKDAQGVRYADDKMIPHKAASTYSFVKEKTKALAKKKQEGEVLTEVEEEWLKDTPKQHKFYISEDLHEKARAANGHTAHPRLLVETNPRKECWDVNLDGRQYAFNFFNRVWPKKEELPQNDQALEIAASV